MSADKAEGSGVRCAVMGMLPAHRCTAGHRGLTWQLDQVAQGNSRCPARQTTARCSRLVGGAQGGEIPAWDLLMCSLSNGWELRNSEPINRINRLVNWDLGKPLTARIPRSILVVEFGHRSSVISWEPFRCLSLWNWPLGESVGHP